MKSVILICLSVLLTISLTSCLKTNIKKNKKLNPLIDDPDIILGRYTGSSLPPIQISCTERNPNLPAPLNNNGASHCGTIKDGSQSPQPAGQAVGKNVLIYWISGRCNQISDGRLNILKAKGDSSSLTIDVGPGSAVQYMDGNQPANSNMFNYINNQTTIEAGDYAVWLVMDSGIVNGYADEDEPIHCQDITVTLELGSIGASNNWRDATAEEANQLNGANF